MAWDGDDYQRRFDRLAAEGVDVHGEAAFVEALGPAHVLDAGCGTGRVAIELARRGIAVVGIDADASMIDTARRLAPDLEWVREDVAAADLGRTFDVVVMAGNVPLFTRPGTQEALVAGCARHLAPGGRLVAGFQLDGRYGLEAYDAHTAAAGLVLERRVGGWAGEPLGAGYAVSVHVRPREVGRRWVPSGR